MTNIHEIRIGPCSPSADLVAYLYDELNAAERSSFETHLSKCESCTNEFAEISFARLNVYEWHRDEFAKLATPRFVVPYAESDTSVSWRDALFGLLAGNRRWATAGGSIALIAVVFGAVMISSMMKGAGDVAKGTAGSVPAKAESAERPLVDSKNVPDVESKEPEIVKTMAPANRSKAANSNKRRSVRTAEPDLKQPVLSRRSKAPRLNEFDDEEDNTLRLGDLLADVDSE